MANTAIGAFGFGLGAKTGLIDFASRGSELAKGTANYLRFSKGLGHTANVVGVLGTVADGLMGAQGWQNHHTADLVIGITTTLMLSGPWGWAIGGTYFLTDLMVEHYTGRSITQNLFD